MNSTNTRIDHETDTITLPRNDQPEPPPGTSGDNLMDADVDCDATTVRIEIATAAPRNDSLDNIPFKLIPSARKKRLREGVVHFSTPA